MTEINPLHQVHEQVRHALPALPQAACLDDNQSQAQIDYFGDPDRLGELLPQLHQLAVRRGWTDGDGSVQLVDNGLRITLSSDFPR